MNFMHLTSIVVFSIVISSQSRGVTVTFDDADPFFGDTDSYAESGFLFTPFDRDRWAIGAFGWGPNPEDQWPSNALGWDGFGGNSILISSDGGSPFTLVSLELGVGPVDPVPGTEFLFFGERIDGSTIEFLATSTLQPSLVTFDGFDRMRTVRISTNVTRGDGAIDNIALATVPEPSCLTLAVFGIFSVLIRRRSVN